jgi:hypothetical protein
MKIFFTSGNINAVNPSVPSVNKLLLKGDADIYAFSFVVQ